jgi:hypothetical protein
VCWGEYWEQEKEFSVKNSDWGSELSAGENIGNRRKSSVLRIVIGVANCVLGRILGTGEREAERYVTRIGC